MFKKTLLLPFFLMLLWSAGAQSFWRDVPNEWKPEKGERRIVPQKERVVQLDLDGLGMWLHRTPQRVSASTEALPVLTLPMPGGGFQRFHLAESPVMAPDLQAHFPESRTYTGTGIDEPGALLKCDLTPWGFHAMILRPGGDAVFIDPYVHGGTTFYTVYDKKDYALSDALPAVCETPDNWNELTPTQGQKAAQGDCLLRRYRLALACTGEYANFHGGTKPLVMAAFVTSMNRINGIYERDLAITMQIIANNDVLIFLDPATDPYTNNSVSTMLDENRNTINAVIGVNNYDIGHVFGTSGGGIAGVGVVCGSNKAHGVTGRSSPVGDPFDVDYVAHEIGHQFGAGHTQNNSCARSSASSMEPGSGSTIMGYAGICTPNVQNNSDDYFHAISLQEMAAFAVSGAGNTCPSKISTGNNPPVVNAGFNYIIPRSTPFALTAVASDPDGDALTYCWEQMDAQFATQPPQTTNTSGPTFRTFNPVSSPTRFFPRLQDLVNNASPTWEVLPSVNRTMNFRVTVRDNDAAGGCTAETNATVSVAASAGPFVVTKPNTTGIIWNAGSMQEVTWDVAGTDVLPVNVANVRISLSTDGGLTYPVVLANNVPNNGSAMVAVPNLESTTCRVRVEARNNIFFDISNQNFQIARPGFSLTLSTDNVKVCSGDAAVVQISSMPLSGFNQPIALSTGGAPAGAVVTLVPDTIPTDGSAVLTITGLTPAMAGVYTVTITAKSDTITQQYGIQLTVLPGVESTALVAPADGENSTGIAPILSWTAATFADNYRLQVADNPSFNAGSLLYDMLVANPSTSLSNPALTPGNVYYWRVRVLNACGEGPWTPFRAFQVGNASCDNVFSNDVPVVIPSNSAVTISSAINVPANALIEQIEVSMSINHVWVGDLSAFLVSPAGDTFALFDRPGEPVSDFGCSGDNLELTFSDQAPWTSDSLEVSCDFNIPAINGAFQPLDAFAPLVGTPAQGTWRLLVVDAFEQDGGALLNWSLSFCFPQSTQVAVLTVNDTLEVGEGLSGVIDNNLLAMSLTGTAAQGRFIVLETPQHGDLRLSGATMGVGDVFSQQEVNNGQLSYRHNGNAATQDAFRFDVFDENVNAWLHDQTFNIRIIPNLLAVDLAAQQTILCAGDAAGVLVATASGSPGPFTYSLNGGTAQSGNVFSNLPAGAYTVVVTGAFGFTATSNTVVLDAPPALTVVASVSGDDITVTGSGGTGSLTYSIDGVNFSANNIFTDLPDGTYTATVRDGNGCTATDEAIVSVDTLFVSAVQSGTIDCAGDATGAITVSAAGGTPPYLYTLNGVDFQDINVFANLPAGSYAITVTDNNSLTAETNVVLIDEPAPISVSAAAIQTRIEVTASGGTGALEYSIDGTNFQPGSVFNSLPNGMYTVTVRDANGCTATTTATVDAAPPTGATADVQNNPCFGGTTGAFKLCVNGGLPPYTVAIDNPQANIITENGPCTLNLAISNLAAGTYTVVITDAQGLSSTLTQTIGQAPELLLSVNTNGDTILASATGGTGALAYSVDGTNYQPEPVFPDLLNGTYTVYVRDANGCIQTQPGVLVTSSVVDLAAAWGLSVSPNPGQGRIRVHLLAAPADIHLDALDATGRLIFRQSFQNPAGEWLYELDLTQQPSGTYWLRLGAGGQSGAVKVVIE
ncbi:MAG: M12 family metallo-peptidase [Saprospiraceae bacterium]|nr:M12 family metallo-peptidase [Saprospiraceae bacterium]